MPAGDASSKNSTETVRALLSITLNARPVIIIPNDLAKLSTLSRGSSDSVVRTERRVCLQLCGY